jgi:hypothetical protein
MATFKARTARKEHDCENCQWHRRGRRTIRRGHRYIRHVAFPSDDYIGSVTPQVMAQCIACTAEPGSEAQREASGACLTFCHGETPCALPDGHAGDHQCLNCDQPIRAEVNGLLAGLGQRARAHREEKAHG